MIASVLGFVLLSPVAGAVAAALGVASVALFYFLKLRRRPMRVGSTMLWEQAVRDLQVNAPFRMIKPSWLLALQLLAVLLLAAAVSRPAIDRPDAAERLVLLLDRSASMQAPVDDSGVTRFEVAVARLDEVLSRTASGTRITLLSFDAEARTEVPYTLDAGAVRAALNALEPTDGPSDLTAGLRLAEAVTASGVSSENEDVAAPPMGRLIVASDGAVTVEAGAGVKLPRTQVEYLAVADPEAEAPENVGIVGASATRDVADPSLIRVFVEAQRNRAEAASVRYSAVVGTDVVSAGSLDLSVDGNVGVGSASFELRGVERAIVEVSLLIDDALEADNTAAIVLEPFRPVSVDMVTPTGTLTTSGQENLYGALIAAGADDVRVTTASGVRAGVDADGNEGDRGGLHVYVGVAPVASTLVPEVVFNADPVLPGLIATPRDPGVASRFALWTRNHPIMRYVALSDVAFAGGYAFDAVPDAEGEGEQRTGARITALASAEDGDVIVLHERGIKRRLLVGVDLSRTTWWKNPSFLVFVINAMDTLTQRAERAAGRALPVGSPATVDAGAPGRVFTLSREGELLGTLTSRADGSVATGGLLRAGIYDVRGENGGDLAAVIGVAMLDRRESLLNAEANIPVAGESIGTSTAAQLAPAEIWKWFVLAALLVMCLEWLLFVRGVRPS